MDSTPIASDAKLGIIGNGKVEKSNKKLTVKSQNRIIAAADDAFQYSKELLVSKSWGPTITLARAAIVALMQKITVGHLRVLTQGQIYEFGPRPGSGEKSIVLKVVNDTFWVRMLILGDLGFAEAYMFGDVVCDDLVGLFKMFVANRENLGDAATVSSRIFQFISYLMNSRFVNSVSNAINNISAHYDISNDMFAGFLSPDMTYSSAIFNSDQDSLQQAQMNKLDYIIDQAHIGKDDHVLEIGSGWGSFSIRAVKRTGCRVTTLTLSVEQKLLAEQRIAAAGFSDRVEVLLCDYRKLDVPATGPFDKVVSIEMIEAVGPEFLATYFECVHRLLKPKGGIAVFQVITMPEKRYERYCEEVDFIRKWIFPGGHCPTVTALVNAINDGSKGNLIVDSIRNIGPHYSKTLRLWREEFLGHYDEIIRPALLKQYPGMTPKEVEVFRSKWEYYFAYCECGFATKTLGDVIITTCREGTIALTEGIPQ